MNTPGAATVQEPSGADTSHDMADMIGLPPTIRAIDPFKSKDINARCLEMELQWFAAVLDFRLKQHFGQETAHQDLEEIPPPQLPRDAAYARVVAKHGLKVAERLVLMLAMTPHLRPHLLDGLMIINEMLNRGFSEFGGWQGKQHGGFLPTCETAAFLTAGDNLEQRFSIAGFFEPDHVFCRYDLLRIQAPGIEEPALSSLLFMPPEALALLTTGVATSQRFVAHFPAARLQTKMEWEDLVLPPPTLAELNRVISWAAFGNTILNDWGLDKILQPGYRALFYGSPGTGKTLAASLLGKRLETPVYRIDLSRVSSKYIGETEKNLARLFDEAASRNQILFFDEADTLFGKRTEAATVNDRHANQETAFLLQRVETHPGVVILATNLESNIDQAFFRRFQSVIHFPMPDEAQRLTLWRQGLSGKTTPTENLDLTYIAQNYKLSGGSITNVIRHAALRTLEHGRAAICQEDLLAALDRNRFDVAKTTHASRPPMMIRGPMNVAKSKKQGL